MADVTPSPRKIFHGGCHCGFIRYAVSLSLPSTPTVTRCNCTFCLKTSFTSTRLPGLEEDFKLISPSSFEEIPDYQFGSKRTHHYFCEKCGVQVCGKGEYEFEGQHVKFFTLNVLTLDQPQDGLDLSQWKVGYWDGRTNNWTGGQRDVPWPNGFI
jgi:hypothetical protein